MSGIVGYRKSAWDGATNAQRAFLRSILNTLKLGSPALGTVGGVEWYVFADHRIDPQFVENLAWANSALPLITSEPDRDYPTTELVQVEVPVRIQVEVPVLDENGDPTGETVLVWRDHPTDTELVDVEQSLGDPLTLAADAQGSVAWFTARQDLPPGWVPSVEEV